MCSNGQQAGIGAQQTGLFTTMQGEAGEVFGENSALYNDMIAQFEPILNKGPDQTGFSDQENTALNTEATEGVSRNFANAEKSVRESSAAEGGGNEYVPSGEEAEQAAEVGEAAASQESTEQNQITEANYATGRENWQAAESGLLNAGSVFAPSEGFNNSAVGAGSAASTTANQIAQENNSWMGAAGGLLGSVVAENPGGVFD